MADFPSSPVSATVPSPTTRLRKGYSNQSRDGTHMVDLVDAISGHTIATCIYEPYADEILAALAKPGVAQYPDQWQPIETAPENHLPVQVYGLYGQLVAFRDVNWIWWSFPNGEDPLNYTPTHWKPLGPNPSDTPTASAAQNPSNAEATVSRIMVIRNGMILDGDAEALIRKEIGGLMGGHAKRPAADIALFRDIDTAFQIVEREGVERIRNALADCPQRVRAILVSDTSAVRETGK
jgi:hypothetical protein